MISSVCVRSLHVLSAARGKIIMRCQAAVCVTNRGSEYCGNPEQHEYELYLAVEGYIDRGGDTRGHDARTSELQRSGHIHTLASNCYRQGHGGLRGIAMSEPIKSQSISRRRLFWLAAIAAAVAAPATMLSTSDARAQQSDQAPAAAPTAPKTEEKKKKKKTKAAPGASTAPASSPPKTAPAPPNQQ